MENRRMFDEIKMYNKIKSIATEKNMFETLKALKIANKLHKPQLRKDGTPYIIHPVLMACDALTLGIYEDDIIATILLHDVCEDCNVLPDELDVNDIIKEAVDLLTFKLIDNISVDESKKIYYNNIANNRIASIAKMVDRCNNVSTMAGVFSKEKLESYIKETRDYVIPMYYHSKRIFKNDSEIYFRLKYHIVSVIDSIDAMLNKY